MIFNALTVLELCVRQINGENNPILANHIDIEMRKKYPHKKPRLVTHKNDIDKQWYIEFGQWSFDKNKIVRKRWYRGFNKIKSLEKRYEYGMRKCRELQKLLPYSYQGVDPGLNKEPLEVQPKEVSKKIDSIEKLIKVIVDDLYKNKNGYNNYISIARKWFAYTETLIAITSLQSFKKSDAQIYVDYMEHQEQLSAVTISNRVSVLKAIFNKAKQRDYIENNPFENLKLPKKVITSKNKAYSHYEIAMVKKEANEFIWLICQFIYYTYIRPIEITRLKVKNVLLDADKILITADDSKNSKSAYIAIPKSLKKLLIAYGIKNYPGHYYLFSRFEQPSETKLSKNHLAKEYKKITKKLDFDKDLTLYSWKHTGVVFAYKNGVDIKAIQLQCRHHSVSQTDTYLKSLGFMDNDEFMKGIPEI